jgi:hypothetical protein
MLDAVISQSSPSHPAQHLPVVQVEAYIDSIAEKIMQEQTPRQLMVIREMMYDLLAVAVGFEPILIRLTRALLTSTKNRPQLQQGDRKM